MRRCRTSWSECLGINRGTVQKVTLDNHTHRAGVPRMVVWVRSLRPVGCTTTPSPLGATAKQEDVNPKTIQVSPMRPHSQHSATRRRTTTATDDEPTNGQEQAHNETTTSRQGSKRRFFCFVLILVFLTRYMRPGGPWQRQSDGLCQQTKNSKEEVRRRMDR